jgi:hypothetical protein
LFVKKQWDSIFAIKNFSSAFFDVSNQLIMRVFLNDIAYLFNNDEFEGEKASEDY